MKLKKINASLLLLGGLLLFVSCSKDANEQSILEKNDDSTDLILARSEEEREIFAKDSRLIDIYNLCNAMVKMNPNQQSADIDSLNIEIKNLAIQLENIYGQEDILVYLNEFNAQNRRSPVVLELVDYTGGGDKCHLDDDGTVNMDDCNFWEYLAVCFKTIGCPERPVKTLYKCVQDVVCETC